MLKSLANLIDRNGQWLASQWVRALRESGNRVFAGQAPEVFWRTALNWIAHLLEALRSGDLAGNIRVFDVTAKRLALARQPLSDTVQLLATFRQALWQLVEERGREEDLSAGDVIPPLSPFFDALEQHLIREYEAVWAQQDSASAEATALEHAEALGRAAEQQALLSQLAQEMLAQPEVGKLADVIARGAAQLLGARRAGVTLYDSAGETLRYQAGYYLPRLAVDTPITVGEGLSGVAAATGETQVAANMREHEDPSVRSAARRLRVRAGVSVPLRGRRTTLGTLDVFDPLAPGFWRDPDLSLLTDLAARAARTIENAQLIAETRHRARRLDRLNEVSRLLMSRQTPGSLARALAEAACELVDAGTAAVWLLDRDSGVMRMEARQNVSREVAAAVTRGEGLLGKVIERGSPRLVRAGGRQSADAHAVLGTHSVALVPLHRGRQIAGLLAVWEKRSGPLTEDDRQWLVALENQFAAALRALELHLETRHYADRLQTSMTQVGASLAAPLKLDDLLKLIADLTAQVAGVPVALIAVRGGDGEWHISASDESVAADDARDQATISLCRRVMEAGETILFAEGSEEAGLSESQRATLGAPALLGIPIAIKNNAVGALLVAAARARAFTAERRHLFTSFAAQAAVAIENVQLFDDVQYQVSMLSNLTWLSAKISGTLEVEAIMPTIASAVAKALDAPLAAVFLRQGSVLRIAPKGHYGLPQEWAREIAIPVDTPLIGDVVERGAPRAVADVVWAKLEDHPLARGTGARAFACVSLGSDRGHEGIVFVGDTAPRAFHLHQIALLSAYANQAALAVKNARLYAEAVTRSDELSTLLDVILTVTSTLDLDEGLQRLLDATCGLLDAPVGAIHLLDEAGAVLQVRATHGIPIDHGWVANLPVGDTVMSPAVTQGIPVASHDLWRDGRVRRRGVARAMGLRSLLTAPLVAKGRTLGVISVYYYQPREFGEAEIRVLRSLGQEAGIAIENARLFEEVRDHSRFLSNLMHEAHHRVRNNLQMVTGLLAMQTSKIAEESAQRALRATIDRINAIAVVHDLLARERLSEVDVKETAQRIVEFSRRALIGPDQSVSAQVVGTRVLLPSRHATSAALAINELVDNALRHGFPNGSPGSVTVSLQQQGAEVLIQVRDTGVGLPPGFDLRRDRGLGLEIVEGLVTDDLGGTVSVMSDGGTTARLTFSTPPPSGHPPVGAQPG
jgi:GAF domain-containing protein